MSEVEEQENDATAGAEEENEEDPDLTYVDELERAVAEAL